MTMNNIFFVTADDALKLSVAHVTGDSVDFITPGQVTEHHVIIDVSGFSCFGLVMPVESNSPISGLVLIFSQLSTRSLFILLLQRNVNLPKVHKPLPQTPYRQLPVILSTFLID